MHGSNVIEQGGERDCAYGEIRKQWVESRMCRCQQESKYTPGVRKVGQAQRERKPDRAAERNCAVCIYTCL
jgi:hypothetical protein